MNDTQPKTADRLALRTAARGGVWLGAAGLTAVLLALLETALPGVLGRAVDAVVGKAPGFWIAAGALTFGVLALTDAVDDLAVGYANARSTAWLRRALVRHFVRVGADAGDRYPPGDMSSRVVGNATATGRAGADLVATSVSLLPAVGAFIALAFIDPWLCVTVAAGIPLLFLTLRAFLRQASEFAARYFEVQGAIAARLAAALAGAKTIAASGTARRETERVLADLPALHREGVGMWRVEARVATQQGLLVPLLEVAVLALAGVELSSGRITPGELLAAAGYAAMATSLVSAVPALTRLARARAAARRVWDVMRQPAVAFGDRSAADGAGAIEFRGVSVRAGDREVLHGIDVIIAGGTLAAVVGRSGSGKSMFAAVAGRLRDPDRGDVLLGGTPLRELSHDALRTAVSYGFEHPALLGDTVRDAIAFGATQPAASDLIAAARHADADGFVRRLPHAYANPLAETPLSGGEAQRIGLARAFAHGGHVLILDDVAASLDTVTDFHITTVLTTALAGRTRIVVAHRVSTAARANTVIWLDNGRIRAVAPHVELWQDLSYRAIFDPGHLAPRRDGNGSAHGVQVTA